ncbi:MAG: hypothetical protein A2X66_03540 [Ignavibacteria bacterium GWA2_54_16]|nr:MAG: hypothetical protein A2X66_03540 [Ignavibacteria bacterium GWA2_54_16]
MVENIGSIKKCQGENNRGKPDFARGNSLGKSGMAIQKQSASEGEPCHRFPMKRENYGESDCWKFARQGEGPASEELGKLGGTTGKFLSLQAW